MQIYFILVLIVSIIHVIEEYFFDWINFVNENKNVLNLNINSIKKFDFILVNSVFIILVIIANIVHEKHEIFSLSIVFLIMINTIFHVVPSIKLKKYMPGLISALFGYMPLSIITVVIFTFENNLSLFQVIISFLIGMLIMALPCVYHVVKTKLNRKR